MKSFNKIVALYFKHSVVSVHLLLEFSLLIDEITKLKWSDTASETGRELFCLSLAEPVSSAPSNIFF